MNFVWDNDGVIPTGENLSVRKENCSTATLLTGMTMDRTRTLASSDRRIADWAMARAYLRFIMCRWQLKMHPVDVMSQALQITRLLKTSSGNMKRENQQDATIRCLSQMKHQLDATLCRFYFCRITLHVSGAGAHHQEYLKLVRRPLVHVFCKNI